MSPAPKAVPDVAETGEGSRAATLGGFIDEESLSAEVTRTNPNYGPHRPHPFQGYIAKVIVKAGIPDRPQVRELCSLICGEVAALPFVPDRESALDDGKTEFDQQVLKTAERAEKALDSPMVMTMAARKIALAALELRAEDPDGTKGIAWVNSPPRLMARSA